MGASPVLTEFQLRRVDALIERQMKDISAAREAIGTASWPARLEDVAASEMRLRIFLVRLGVVPSSALLD